MKETNLEQSIREAAKFNRDLNLPEGQRTQRNWPMCMKCMQEVESTELVNVNNKSCEIRAICSHGQGPGHEEEDFYRVNWVVPVSDLSGDILEDRNVGWAIKRAMRDAIFFRPEHQFDYSSKR